MAQTIADYHARLEAIMADGDALLQIRTPLNACRLKQHVADAVMVVASYQIFVHREVFAPVLASADAEQRARITELKVECIALTEDLRFNVRGFLASEGPIDWDRVAEQVAWFNARVRAHVARVAAVLERQEGLVRRVGTIGERVVA